MFIEFFRHLDQNYKKKEPSDLDKGKKYEKSHMLAGKSVSRKKNETEVCLLFWLEIRSIIGAYFIPIVVQKFQLKICVKSSAKTRGFLSPILLFCAFHCFNC